MLQTPGEDEHTKHIFDSTTNIYTLKWESSTEKDLYWSMGQAIASATVKGLIAYAGGAITKVGAAILAASNLIDLAPISALFKKAK